MKERTNPNRNPATTCDKECCLRIILLVPNKPATMIMIQSHHTGLYEKMPEKAISAPATPPMAAVWVLIFQKRFTKAHTT